MVVAYLDLPLECETRDKMQFVYKESTHDGVKSKAPKSEFHL